MTPPNEQIVWDPRLFQRQLAHLGARVRTVRQSHAWPQWLLGDRAEIDRPNISRIECGTKKNVTMELLWRLARAFELHWADLLDDRLTDLPDAPYASRPLLEHLRAVGIRVYQARVVQRLSQPALADRISLGSSTMYAIEVQHRNITLNTLSRLATGLHVHWADLLDDRQDHPPLPAPRDHTPPAALSQQSTASLPAGHADVRGRTEPTRTAGPRRVPHETGWWR